MSVGPEQKDVASRGILSAVVIVVILSDEQWFALMKSREEEIGQGVELGFLGDGDPPVSPHYSDIVMHLDGVWYTSESAKNKHPGRFLQHGRAQ
jgi:hypothetical protein